MTCPVLPALDTIWLGKAGSMIALPRPDTGISGQLGRGAASHALVSGGTTITRRPKTKIGYSLGWSQRTPDELEPVVGFYAGSNGRGPFRLLDPQWRNQLDLASSTMDGAEQANTAWVDQNNNYPTLDATIAPPSAAPGSAVLRWGSPATNASLTVRCDRSVAGVFTYTGASIPPYLPGQSTKLSLWVCKIGAGAVSVILRAAGVESDQHYSGTRVASSAALALTTSWQRITVDATAVFSALAGIYWVAPLLVCSAGVVGTDVAIAAAQHEATANVFGGFNTGLGVPNVVIGDPMSSGGTVWWRRSHSLTLTEV
jgi:hypothetical protein